MMDADQHHRRWNAYLNIPNEWVLGRDYSKSELEVRMILLTLFNRSLIYVIDSVATYFSYHIFRRGMRS
jgi:hypothetical protein